MGRNRKSAAIREIEGRRAHRPIPVEIQPRAKPEAPMHLTAEQRERWDEIVIALPDEFLTFADNQVMERMSIAWARFREATILINRSGLLTRGQKGEPNYNPLLRVQKIAAEEMHVCGLLLGLSPLARARLAAPEKVDEDPLTVLL